MCVTNLFTCVCVCVTYKYINELQHPAASLAAPCPPRPSVNLFRRVPTRPQTSMRPRRERLPQCAAR